MNSIGKTLGNGMKPLDIDMSVFDTITRERKRGAYNKTEANKMKQFIFWDGEGITHSGNERQSYVLFGSSHTDPIIAKQLTTTQCLNAIMAAYEEFPNAYHVAFAFDYDVNMILTDLKPSQWERLAKYGTLRIGEFRVEHLPHKWFSVTRIRNGKRQTVRIADLFGFFQCSFVTALKSYIPNHPLMNSLDIVEAGKADRNKFTYDNIDEIKRYWKAENQLGVALADQLREYLYSVDLNITQWHGPGALANYTYKKNNIAAHKDETSMEVRQAARYAYAGGRFELFRMGRHVGPVYSLDINSAYPAAISNLPSLTEGVWIHTERPTEIQEFGVYHIRMRQNEVLRPGPVFHRDAKHNISFPWLLEGWYWSPEIVGLIDNGLAEVIEGYEYVDWQTRPFGFVKDMYTERRQLKANGVGSEKALKLALNSLYGKMAQRVGWEHTGHAPTWHQLSWAGYVTSATRATLYAQLAKIPHEHLIGVETDGIYTTANPTALGIEHSMELGGWEIAEYEEMLYAQSGVYFYKQNGKWKGKYRGLDKGSLTAPKMQDYLRSLKPNSEWAPISGPTTRFIGYKAALARSTSDGGAILDYHRRWLTQQKDIKVGAVGKRLHNPTKCQACDMGATAYDMPHDLIISSMSVMHPMSAKHDIPWEANNTVPAWRTESLIQQSSIMAGV